MKFAQWLEKQYLEWAAKSGKRKTLKEFAEHLGISDSLLNYYIHGTRKPSDPTLEKISAKLGDEAYDALNRPRPDPVLRKIKRKWEVLTAEQKARVENIVDEVD